MSMGGVPGKWTVTTKAADAGERPEEELIRRVQSGERERFYELVKPYERRVYAAALAILRNEADAEDAAQEAILKALQHIRQFRAEARFSTWLTQIAVNEALMRRRKQHSDVMEPIGERLEEDGTYTPRDFADWREIPSESLERKEIREVLAKALASLKAQYREVFVLRDVQHFSIEETAEALGISRASVKTRLLRARLMLRDLLAPGLGSGFFGRLPFEKGSKPW
jgi:RNA polymerase sigma-70 factor, ECF subfamily